MKKKINLIIEILELLYPNPLIPLFYKNPFTFLISVLLSSRSKDKKVNEITSNLFKKADTPEKMVLLKINEIIKLIKKLGLYNKKAKNIQNISKILIEKYNGKIPKNFKELEKLPGIGHKSASIIMSQIFKKNTFPVDTHIHRLMNNWGLSNGKNIKQTEKDAKKLFPKKLWNKLHLQIISYGKEHPTSKKLSLKKDIITQLNLVKF